MPRSITLLVLSATLTLASAVPVFAQAPQSQPLVQAGNFAYLGKFTLPTHDPAGSALEYGGSAIGIGPDGASLYYGCHSGTRLARVTLPGIGGMASVIEPCTSVPGLTGINPSDPNNNVLGGSLSWNGRLLVSAYTYYDANYSQTTSHMVGGSIASLGGPSRIGNDLPGLVAGYMGVVPAEWRALLGGPALTGQCCVSIISRTSYGPAASVFDPDTVGTGSTPTQMLVGYPDAHQTLGGYSSTSPNFNGSTRVGGVAFPAGTRSVLFVGRQGSTYCYGEGTTDASLHGAANPNGGIWCHDPTNPYKGPHGYPYRHQVWAYDALDLALVRIGAKNPWDVLPYGVWTLTDIDGGNGTASMQSVAYDPATRRLYVVTENGGNQPAVHVYEITNAVLQPSRQGPQGFAVAAANGAWNFSWQPPASPGFSAFQIEAGTAAGLSDIGTVVLPATTTTLSLPAPPSGRFFLRVRALYPDGGNPQSNEIVVSAGTVATTPTPTGVTATASGSTLMIAWAGAVGASVSDVLLDAGTAPGLSNIVAGVSIGTSGSFAAGGVPAGRYYLRLRAVGAGGVSPTSNEASANVGQSPVGDVPGAPDGFRASSSNGTVTMTWSPPEEGPDATGYLLDVGSRSGASDLVAGVALPVVTRFVVPDVPPGVYYLRLRSTNAAGASAPGGEVRLVVR